MCKSIWGKGIRQIADCALLLCIEVYWGLLGFIRLLLGMDTFLFRNCALPLDLFIVLSIMDQILLKAGGLKLQLPNIKIVSWVHGDVCAIWSEIIY